MDERAESHGHAGDQYRRDEAQRIRALDAGRRDDVLPQRRWDRDMIFPQMMRPRTVSVFPNLSDTLWVGCTHLLYGNDAGGIREHISDTRWALPAGVSWDGDSLYFNQAATAYFEFAGTKNAINAANAGTLAVVAQPAAATTDLRLMGRYDASPDQSKKFLIWRDELGSTDNWSAAVPEPGITGSTIIQAIAETDFSRLQTLVLANKSFYVDGMRAGFHSSTASFNLAADIRLGQTPTLTPNYKGWVKFAAVWSRDLTADDVLALHQGLNQ